MAKANGSAPGVPDLADRAETLRTLHYAPQPLLLPNVWDVATARLVAEAGFPVIATSSLAVASSLGFPDTNSMAADEAFAAVARIASRVDLPVTADLEAGYGLTARELIGRLLDAGAVGCNLEDTDHGGDGLVPLERQVQWLQDVREAGEAARVSVVINARVDVFLREIGDPESRLPEAIRRGKAYLEAGADCVYPIGLTDRAAIETFVQELKAPVNIWLRPDGPSRDDLARLGVKRISLAAGLFRRAMAEVQRVLEDL